MQSSGGIEIDPFLEQSIKDHWASFDINKEGEVPFETFWKLYSQKTLNRGYVKSEREINLMKENCRRKVDPHHTGKVTFEGWKNLVLFGYYMHKQANGNI